MSETLIHATGVSLRTFNSELKNRYKGRPTAIASVVRINEGIHSGRYIARVHMISHGSGIRLISETLPQKSLELSVDYGKAFLDLYRYVG